MDPISIGLLAGSIAPSIIGLFGGNDGKAYTDKAIQELIKVHVPDPKQQELELQNYQLTGQLSPQLEQTIKADPSAFEEIIQNQKYAQAQDRALSQLQTLGEEGGLSLSDKAELQEQLLANANKDKANRDAITDEMARRGQLGSGMSLQAQLAGAQSAGDRDAQARLQALGSAQDRALQSIMGAGDLAGKLQGQDYQMKSDLASARDRINQFNTTNAQNVQQRNVAAQNDAQAANLAMRQKVSDANTDLANKQQQYNKELQQKQFENQMQKSGAMANAYTGAANQQNQSNAQNKQAWGAVGSAAGQLGSTLQNQNNWDKWLEATKNKKPNLAGSSYTDFSGYA